MTFIKDYFLYPLFIIQFISSILVIIIINNLFFIFVPKIIIHWVNSFKIQRKINARMCNYFFFLRDKVRILWKFFININFLVTRQFNDHAPPIRDFMYNLWSKRYTWAYQVISGHMKKFFHGYVCINLRKNKIIITIMIIIKGWE